MFGGWNAAGSITDDTWEYDGSVWSQVLLEVRPPVRGAHSLAYDSARGRVVLFGGLSAAGRWMTPGSTTAARVAGRSGSSPVGPIRPRARV